MPARTERQYFLTDRQMQDYTDTIEHLEGLRRESMATLKEIEWSTFNIKRYLVAGILLRDIAGQMQSGLQFLREILRAAEDQRPATVEFVVSPRCSTCYAAELETQLQESTSREPEPPAPEPADTVSALSAYDDLYELLVMVLRVRRRLGLFTERHKAVPTVLITGLKCFSDAVVKEMKLLRETAPMATPDIQFRMNGPNCSHCQGPMEVVNDPIAP
jgi:hypothetical protein